jgi:hypothetical protein
MRQSNALKQLDVICNNKNKKLAADKINIRPPTTRPRAFQREVVFTDVEPVALNALLSCSLNANELNLQSNPLNSESDEAGQPL